MDEQIAIMLALAVVCVCSAAFAMMVPMLAMAIGRGRLSALPRVFGTMAALAVISLAVAAALGSSTAAQGLAP